MTTDEIARDPLDPARVLDEAEGDVFATVADHLIPTAHGMPSARDVVDARRLDFVLRARPDLLEPLRRALGRMDAADAETRLAALHRDDPSALDALLFVIVGGYYTDGAVRDLIGYPGQLALPVNAAEYPPYLAEGLIAQVQARGPVWKDPVTGRRAEPGR